MRHQDNQEEKSGKIGLIIRKQCEALWSTSSLIGSVSLAFGALENYPGMALLSDLRASKMRVGYGTQLVNEALNHAYKQGAEGVVAAHTGGGPGQFWAAQDGWEDCPASSLGLPDRCGAVIYRFEKSDVSAEV